MKSTSRLSSVAALSLSVAAAGCGSSAPRAQLPSTTPPSPPVAVSIPQAPSSADPIAALIKTSDRHFTNGQRQLQLGHLEQAKVEFDRALEVLLESPYGARSEPRIREHFDRLVDRISVYEMNALAQGDGFVEKKYEPASIDQLLALSTTFEPAPPTQELKEAVREDLASTRHDIPIPLNSKVLSYVDLFQGRLRDYLQDGLLRGARYLPMIQNVFRAEGLPLDLAYIPLIESAFKPNALSRAKAKGVWQFMRGTALENGLKHDWYIDERSDPEKATVAAAKYLRTLHRIFEGDWHLAMASYNGGPGRVQRAVKRSGLDDFWTLTDGAKYLPRETREYVPMILAAIIIAKNPVEYGFTLAPVAEPIAYEKVPVPRAVDLRRVAEWTGTSIEEIQTLNPELRRWTTPVKYGYEVKVPQGTASLLQARLKDASPGDFTALKWHVVKRGESLATIARKLKVSRVDLAEANSLSVASRVRTGQQLIIPRAPATVLTARIDRPAPADQLITASRSLSGVGAPTAASAKAATDDRPAAPATPAAMPARAASPSGTVVYRVKRGDTLFSIARLYRTTVDALKSWNRIRGNIIAPGDRLKIVRK